MKKFCSFWILLITALSLFTLVSCGEGENNENDDKNVNDNEVSDIEDVTDNEDSDIDVTDEDETVDEAPVELAYPEPSATSKEAGDIARNLFFFDEKNVERQLAEWYRLNNEKIKLIWLIFSAYDCSVCAVEKKDIPVLNGKYADEGMQTILIMNGSYQTGPKPSEEPDNVANLKDTMITVEGKAANHIYGYLSWGQQGEFEKFMSTGYPVNVFIDANTMEVLKYTPGWSEEQDFFDDIDGFIDAVLDFL